MILLTVYPKIPNYLQMTPNYLFMLITSTP